MLHHSPNMPQYTHTGTAEMLLSFATKHEPTDLILDVAKYYDACNGESLIDSIHVYPFGGLKQL